MVFSLLYKLKSYLFFTLLMWLMLPWFLCSDTTSAIGIIGGATGSGSISNVTPYLSIVSSSGELLEVDGDFPSPGQIIYGAMNSLGQSIISGRSFFPTTRFTGFVSPSGVYTPIDLSYAPNTVSINCAGYGLLTTQGGSPPAVFISPSGDVTPITGVPGLTNGYYGTIDCTGRALLIRKNNASSDSPNAYFVSPSLDITNITLTSDFRLSATFIPDVPIDVSASGQALIGGYLDSSNAAYAALISSAGDVTSLTGLPSPGTIFGVSLNCGGEGLIGGASNSTPAIPYAAFVASSGDVTPITGLPSEGSIYSTAINCAGQGIIGGGYAFSDQDVFAYAALVSPAGELTPILNTPGIYGISQVAINSFGQGIIKGERGYIALVSASGELTTLLEEGLSTAWVGISDLAAIFFAEIPGTSSTETVTTGALTGNNLIFANYINTYSPQNVFYFIPSLLNGTLITALESAAPTRNSLSFYTANNNLSLLTGMLRNRLRQQRGCFLKDRSSLCSPCTTFKKRESTPLYKAPPCLGEKELKYTIWSRAVGALSYQKSQEQIPSFASSTEGWILAYNAHLGSHVTLGSGISYLQSKLHVHQGQGRARLKQEDALAYISWDGVFYYGQGTLIAGLFQVDQIRNIRMGGFSFETTSSPTGGQIDSSFEIGFHQNIQSNSDFRATIGPFLAADWVNGWYKGFQESGNGPFRIHQNGSRFFLFRTEVGVRCDESFVLSRGSLILQERIGYVNKNTYGSGEVTGSLLETDHTFTLKTLQAEQNLGITELSIAFQPLKPSYPTITAGYQGEWNEKYQSHKFALELSWSF